MDFEEFKEQFAEDVKNDLEGKGIDASVKVNSVEKMNILVGIVVGAGLRLGLLILIVGFGIVYSIIMQQWTNLLIFAIIGGAIIAAFLRRLGKLDIIKSDYHRVITVDIYIHPPGVKRTTVCLLIRYSNSKKSGTPIHTNSKPL